MNAGQRNCYLALKAAVEQYDLDDALFALAALIGEQGARVADDWYFRLARGHIQDARGHLRRARPQACSLKPVVSSL
jgi:hypothetical protein